MNTIDKKARIMAAINDWADVTTQFIPASELKILTGLIISEIVLMEHEEEVRNAELNVSTMPEEGK